MKFLVEIVRATKEKVGPDFPLDVRLSGTEYEPGGIMIEDTLELAKALEKLGIDVLHLSGGNQHRRFNTNAPPSMPLGNNVWAAEAVKKVVHIPVIASGSITTQSLLKKYSKAAREILSPWVGLYLLTPTGHRRQKKGGLRI